MTTNYAKNPMITWNAGFSSSLVMNYPIDNWQSYSVPRQGSEWLQSQSGIEDSWITGTDFYLEAEIRWLTNSQWDGASGWRAFMEWARAKNQFRWIPDATNPGTYILSYLSDPMDKSGITTEADGTRSIKITIRNAVTDYVGY